MVVVVVVVVVLAVVVVSEFELWIFDTLLVMSSNPRITKKQPQPHPQP